MNQSPIKTLGLSVGGVSVPTTCVKSSQVYTTLTLRSANPPQNPKLILHNHPDKQDKYLSDTLSRVHILSTLDNKKICAHNL